MSPEKKLELRLFPSVIASSSSVSSLNTQNQNNESFPKIMPISSIMKITRSDTREFICGWGAAVINVTVTYPINKIIFRQVIILELKKFVNIT